MYAPIKLYNRQWQESVANSPRNTRQKFLDLSIRYAKH